MVSRITVRHDTAMDARYPEGIPNRITLHLKDGRTLTEENTFPRGHARNPMSDEEVEAKFYVLTEWALSRAAGRGAAVRVESGHPANDCAADGAAADRVDPWGRRTACLA